MSELSSDSARLYGVLGVLRVLADSRSAELLVQAASPAPSPALREVARYICERYLDERSDYDWVDTGMEVSKIEGELRASLTDPDRELVEMLSDLRGRPELETAAAAWRELVLEGDMSGLAVSERAKSRLVSTARAVPMVDLATPSDAWDVDFLANADSWDPESIAYSLLVTAVAKQSWQDMAAEVVDRAAFAAWISAESGRLGIPTEIARTITTLVTRH